MSERVKCLDIINTDSKLVKEFEEFLKLNKKHLRKIKSINRKAYIFLTSKFGRARLKYLRYHTLSFDEMVRIVKTPWIKVEQ